MKEKQTNERHRVYLSVGYFCVWSVWHSRGLRWAKRIVSNAAPLYSHANYGMQGGLTQTWFIYCGKYSSNHLQFPHFSHLFVWMSPNFDRTECVTVCERKRKRERDFGWQTHCFVGINACISPPRNNNKKKTHLHKEREVPRWIGRVPGHDYVTQGWRGLFTYILGFITAEREKKQTITKQNKRN